MGYLLHTPYYALCPSSLQPDVLCLGIECDLLVPGTTFTQLNPTGQGSYYFKLCDILCFLNFLK